MDTSYIINVAGFRVATEHESTTTVLRNKKVLIASLTGAPLNGLTIFSTVRRPRWSSIRSFPDGRPGDPGLILSYLSFSLTFSFAPLAGTFAHIGDRIGRKTLVLTSL